ncbi:MAG: ribosome maturation factor RimM [Bacilli bacterium]|jgi:16S rRNA processing protein RimM|nr:ribosome maturation factor RimM [Bacilli bacterium]
MEYLLIGKFVDTHGIRGEIRIISDCRFKKKVFQKENPVYIGKEKNKYIIKSYRKHKNFDMIKLEGINNINEINQLKGQLVYINEDELDLDGELEIVDHLIGYKVYMEDRLVGYVIDYYKGVGFAHDILVVTDNRYKIPYVEDYINSISIEKREIHIKKIRGLIDEN